jgi:hypothetical protein
MIEVNVFVEPHTHASRCAKIKVVFAPRIGESIDVTMPGFANNVRGKITKIIHTTELEGGEPSVYVFITPMEDI